MLDEDEKDLRIGLNREIDACASEQQWKLKNDVCGRGIINNFKNK